MKNKKVFILAGLVVLAVAVGGFMMFGQPAPAPADSGLLVQSGSAGEGGPEESGATESTPGSEDLDYLAATEAERALANSVEAHAALLAEALSVRAQAVAARGPSP